MTWFRFLRSLMPHGARPSPGSGSYQREARDLIGLGKARRGLGEFAAAESDLRDGAKLYEAEHDDYEQGNALNELAMTLVAAGREGDAREIWKQLAAKPHGDPSQRRQPPESIFDLYRGNTQLASLVGGVMLQVETLNAARRAVGEARRSGDRRAEAEGLLRQSEMLRERGMDVPEAMRLADQAAAVFHELHDVGEARAYYALGRAREDAKLPEDALTAYQITAQLAQHAGSTQVQAQALERIGSLLTTMGQLAKGIESLEHSVRLSHQAGDAHGEGRAKSGLGIVLLRRGRYDEAATEFRAAIDVCRSAGELSGRASAQINLPIALLKAGRYPESIAASLEALDVCRDINYQEGTTEALANLGFAYLMEGHYPASRQRYDQLLKRVSEQRAQRKGHLSDELVKLVGNSGIDCWQAAEAWLKEKRYKESVEAYSRAADLFAASGDGEKEATALLKLGLGFSLLGRWENSNEAYDRAYEVSIQRGKSNLAALARAVLGGNLVDSGHPEKALPYLNWALKEGQRLGDALVQGTATHNLEVARRKMGSGAS
jgi:tetratricopeptide (TPR) repeat protein